jgi:hypothetical protein
LYREHSDGEWPARDLDHLLRQYSGVTSLPFAPPVAALSWVVTDSREAVRAL